MQGRACVGNAAALDDEAFQKGILQLAKRGDGSLRIEDRE